MKKVIYLFVLFFSFSFYGQNDTISNNINQISKVFIKTRNVIYRGIKNEIFITVPNFENLTILFLFEFLNFTLEKLN